MSAEHFVVQDSLAHPDAMAAKRARVEVPKSFADIDLADLSLRAVKVRGSDAMTVC